MPIGTARASADGTSVIGTADAVGAVARVVDAVADVSATDPQAWHSLQRPTHTGDTHPHSPHRYVAVVFAMDVTLPAASDIFRTRPRRARSQHVHTPHEACERAVYA